MPNINNSPSLSNTSTILSKNITIPNNVKVKTLQPPTTANLLHSQLQATAPPPPKLQPPAASPMMLSDNNSKLPDIIITNSTPQTEHNYSELQS